MQNRSSTAIEPAEFAALMDRCRPFERHPHIAVGCSGGPDSLALTALLAGWVESQDGRLTTLIIDHRLRRESAAEAARVRRQLREHGVTGVVLTAPGPRPRSDVQNTAREQRYGLMTAWCRSRRILHLALAHHQDDQAETVLLRLGRGSGVDGLAAMAPVSDRRDLRLLRPLLDIPKDRLTATCRSLALEPVFDPVSRLERFHLRAIGREEVDPCGLAVAGPAARLDVPIVEQRDHRRRSVPRRADRRKTR